MAEIENPDRDILEAHAAALAMRAEGYRRDDETDGEWEGAAEHDARMKELEAVVERTPAQTIGGVVCRLSILAPRLDGSREADRALCEQGFEALYAARESFTWEAGQVLEAIHDLRQIDPLRAFAEAWVDRWLALGGGFGWVYDKDRKPKRRCRNIPMSYTWEPPAEHTPALKPHQWITKAEDFDGAQKMLESFLSLVPGLDAAIYEVAEAQGLIETLDAAALAGEGVA